MSSLASFKAFFHRKPTIVISVALGIAGLNSEIFEMLMLRFQ
jgi:hypothetical protein